MSAKTYGIIMRAMAVLVAALIAVSIVQELPVYLPLIVIMVMLVAANMLRRLVKEIMSDERSTRIDEKATVSSYRIYMKVTAIIVLVAIMLRGSLPEWAGIAAQTLAYSLCVLMLTHMTFTRYYSNKI